jgi:hypothetical protein
MLLCVGQLILKYQEILCGHRLAVVLFYPQLLDYRLDLSGPCIYNRRQRYIVNNEKRFYSF